jgi:hypothetical protein
MGPPRKMCLLLSDALTRRARQLLQKGFSQRSRFGTVRETTLLRRRLNTREAVRDVLLNPAILPVYDELPGTPSLCGSRCSLNRVTFIAVNGDFTIPVDGPSRVRMIDVDRLRHDFYFTPFRMRQHSPLSQRWSLLDRLQVLLPWRPRTLHVAVAAEQPTVGPRPHLD